MRFQDAIQVQSNLKITARERGKLVARREGHNIFVNLGREWLAKLISYSSYSGAVGVPEDNHRIRYMGFGIGGNRQAALGLANASPLGGATPVNDYAGPNIQSDTDATDSTLERPVRLSWAGTTPTPSPYDPVGDVWLGQVAPITGLTGHPVATTTQFTRLFSTLEINGPTSYYNAVPLSEIGLFHDGANPNSPSSAANPTNTLVAYDTFDTIIKTVAIEIEIQWQLRF